MYLRIDNHFVSLRKETGQAKAMPCTTLFLSSHSILTPGNKKVFKFQDAFWLCRFRC